ncbi:MAG: hypothetical protein Q7S79_04045 [bacterium]|nr:hypothetical protein [bacterium]
MTERQTNTNIYPPELEKVFNNWLNPESLQISWRSPARFLAESIRNNLIFLQGAERSESEEKILLGLKRRVDTVFIFSTQRVDSVGTGQRTKEVVLAAKAAVRGEIETVAIYCHEGWIIDKLKNDFLIMAYLARAAKEEDPDKQMKFFAPVIALTTASITHPR